MKREFSVVGKRLPRPDAFEKATGAAKFAGDIKLPGMLVGKVLRSPYPHARILKVDTSKAEKLPGVEAVVTIKDVKKNRPSLSSFQNLAISPVTGRGIPELSDETIFVEKAHFVGDPIAAVAAVNERVAEEALELIEVEYEQLPVVLDPEEAMKPGAPVVHDSVPNNVPIHRISHLNRGDVKKAFQEADLVVEDTFRNSRQSPAPLEPAVGIASFDDNGRLTVWVQSQMPHLARRQLAYILDMPEGMIRLITPYIGGSFGLRNGMSPEIICPLLAKKTGKPVKIEYTKDEDFRCYGPRPEIRNHLKLGFKKDGTLVAIQSKSIADTGAYISKTTTHVSLFLGFTLEGPYQCPNKLGEIDYVYTNHERTSAFRGMGNDIAMWAFEQLMDRAAKKLGIDPLELRLRNLKKAGDPSWAGIRMPIASSALDECIKLGAEKIGWREKRAGKKAAGIVKRGVGVAVMMHLSGAHPFLIEQSNAFIKLHEDGSASLFIHPAEVGQGTLATLAQIAAEELGVRAEDIHVVTGDTDVTLFDSGSYGSRTCYMTGKAVLGAAQEVKKQVLERAAKSLGVPADKLETKDRWIFVREEPDKKISIAQIATEAICNLRHEGAHISGKCLYDASAYSPPTQAAFVEADVNTGTGEVRLLKVVIANDSGTSINPTTVEGQLEGGAVQAIGYALYENPQFDPETGVCTTDNFETYKIPTIFDIPETELILVEKPDPVGPFGAKGVGEASIVTLAPAIANAIYDAIGVQITDLPITPEKILKALKEKSKA